MRNLIIIGLIALNSCAGDVSPPKIATTRFCDATANYIASLINPTYNSVALKYTVYVDTNDNKRVDWFEPIFYSSPILRLRSYETTIIDPLPIDPKWNKFTLITIMETTYGNRSEDKLYPCERHLEKPIY